MSTTTTPKDMIITGGPFGWIHWMKTTGGTAALACPETWKFDNLQKPSIKLMMPASSSSSSSSTIDITRADGTITRFPKEALIMDGTTETDITPAAASSDATSKGVFTLVINEAPQGMSMTAFLKDIQSKISELFLITIATGFSYDGLNTQGKVDGWAYMLGKLSADIDFDTTQNTITLVFNSYKMNATTYANITNTILSGITYTALKRKPKATTFAPSSGNSDIILAADATTLMGGDIVLKSSATYVYV